MLGISRFDCASSSLALKTLLTKTYRVLWICLGVGIIAHLSLMQIGIAEQEQRVVKPLTTQFVKRQPRLTKPLELKKRPRPKRRTMQRQMVAVRAKVDRQDLSSRGRPVELLGSLARPQTTIASAVSWTGIEVEPHALAEVIEGTRDPQDKMDMSLELMDVEAMDTGRYHAMVIQDPNDKRGIRGFIHIAMAAPLTGGLEDGKQWRWRRGVQNLSDFMNHHTAIRSDVNKFISFDSAELFETPWVYLCQLYGFDITDGELSNIGRYMMSGGFFWGDSFGVCTQYEGGRESSNHTIIKSLEDQGLVHQKDWNFERLPNSHPILHCYFDFDSVPKGWGASSNIFSSSVFWDNVPYLEAVVMDGVVICLKTKQAYASAWGDWGPNGLHSAYRELDPTRCFQFGVNTIIYALTREDSITHRVMDSVK